MRYYYGGDESLDYGEVNRAVEAVFREHARGHVQMPPKVYITFPHGDFRTMPAYVPPG
jgi:alanine dehydrogenase